ncbi:hypothetical protein BH09BAC6_BH09BAC6_32310 [soil metagenome]|jgi:hypothetical protein
MKIKLFGGLLVAALAVTSIAQAQTHTPVINTRQHMQDHRINRGVRNGKLTSAEARRLRARERKISNDKRMAKADGRVTHAERKHLRREENRTSRAIRRAKHNNSVRRAQ